MFRCPRIAGSGEIFFVSPRICRIALRPLRCAWQVLPAYDGKWRFLRCGQRFECIAVDQVAAGVTQKAGVEVEIPQRSSSGIARPLAELFRKAGGAFHFSWQRARRRRAKNHELVHMIAWQTRCSRFRGDLRDQVHHARLCPKTRSAAISLAGRVDVAGLALFVPLRCYRGEGVARAGDNHPAQSWLNIVGRRFRAPPADRVTRRWGSQHAANPQLRKTAGFGKVAVYAVHTAREGETGLASRPIPDNGRILSRR